MASPSISLCMIVRNEERTLSGALASAKPWVSEMIVVDTGSTDRTREIALEHGAQLFEMVWPDSFAEARNESIRHANCDWIMCLDADERISESTGEAIGRLTSTAPETVGVFSFPEQNYLGGHPASRFMHPKLFRNHCGFYFKNRAHEYLVSSGYETVMRGETIDHSAHDQSREGQVYRDERNRKLLLLDLKDDPENLSTLTHLARHVLFFDNDPLAAEKYARRAINLNRASQVAMPPSGMQDCYLTSSIANTRMGNTALAAETVDEGLSLFPKSINLFFMKGELLAQAGEYELAKRVFMECAKRGETGSFPPDAHMGFVGYQAYHNIGAMFAARSEYSEALIWFEKALSVAPNFEPSRLAAQAVREMLTNR
jgi:hypothetical protein